MERKVPPALHCHLEEAIDGIWVFSSCLYTDTSSYLCNTSISVYTYVLYNLHFLKIGSTCTWLFCSLLNELVNLFFYFYQGQLIKKEPSPPPSYSTLPRSTHSVLSAVILVFIFWNNMIRPLCVDLSSVWDIRYWFSSLSLPCSPN